MIQARPREKAPTTRHEAATHCIQARLRTAPRVPPTRLYQSSFCHFPDQLQCFCFFIGVPASIFHSFVPFVKPRLFAKLPVIIHPKTSRILSRPGIQVSFADFDASSDCILQFPKSWQAAPGTASSSHPQIALCINNRQTLFGSFCFLRYTPPFFRHWSFGHTHRGRRPGRLV